MGGGGGGPNYKAQNGVVKESQMDVYIRFRDLPKAYSEPRQTSKIEHFEETLNVY